MLAPFWQGGDDGIMCAQLAVLSSNLDAAAGLVLQPVDALATLADHCGQFAQTHSHSIDEHR